MFTFYLKSDIVQTMKEEKTILDRITDTLNFLSLILSPIIWLICVIFDYLSRFLSDIAKNVHNRLVKWIGGIIFLIITSLIIYLLNQ